jgi:hypothetical protein
MRANDRTDNDDPKCAKSITDRENTDPMRAKPKSDTAEPKRANERSDIEAPRCRKSNTDREEPKRNIERIDSDAPS